MYNISEFTPSEIREFIAGHRAVLSDLFNRPESERLAVVRRALALFDATRAQRSVPGADVSLRRRGLSLLHNPDAAAAGFAFGGHNDFWTAIDGRDAVQAFEKALLANVQGHHALFITGSHNLAGMDTELLLRLFFPVVTARKRSIQGTQSAVSIDKARRLIGFEPEFPLNLYYPE